MPDALTYGVAIAVPEPFGSELRSWRAAFGDPMAGTVPSHVTLLPPETTTADGVADISARLGAVAGRTSPFTVALQGTGTFRPVSPVVFVAVSAGISESEILSGRLREALDVAPAEFPFHPHVTVAHHLDDPALDHALAELADFRCTFEATEFALYLHDDTTGWAPHTTFPLTG